MISFDLEGNELVPLDSSNNNNSNNSVWTLDGAIRYPVLGRFPVRMVIIRLNSGSSDDENKKSRRKLLVWSPFPPPPESEPNAREKYIRQIESLGTVAYIVAPNSLHWMGVMPFAQACSNTRDIQICVAPGLTQKPEALDAGLKWDFVLSNEIPPEWSSANTNNNNNNNEIQVKYIPGIPQLEEVILYHTSSKTLLIGDMAFHFQRPRKGDNNNPKLNVGGYILPLYLYAVDGYRPCCLTRTFQWIITDIEACCRAMQDVVDEWHDLDCIVMAHGAIISKDAKRILTEGTVSLLQEWRNAKRNSSSGKILSSWPVAAATVALVAISSIGLAMLLAGKAAARKR
jgi:hypothetical protein